MIYTYSCRINEKGFVWGGKGIATSASLSLVLHIRVPEEGETVEVRTVVPGGAETFYGTLLPGEVATLHLAGVSGIHLSSTHDVTIDCAIQSLMS